MQLCKPCKVERGNDTIDLDLFSIYHFRINCYAVRYILEESDTLLL